MFYLGSGSWNDTFDQQFRLVYANTAERSTDENYTNRGSQVVMFPSGILGEQPDRIPV